MSGSTPDRLDPEEGSSADQTRGSSAEEDALLVALGARLRMLRRLAARTEQDVATTTGLSVEVLRLIESGGMEPSLLMLRRIAAAVGVGSWLQTVRIAEYQVNEPAAAVADGPSNGAGLHVSVTVTTDASVTAAVSAELGSPSKLGS